MKKIIYSAVVVLCAIAVVSCGNGGKKIQKGSKSKYDSVSYAVGADIGFGVSKNMPDLKFDWKTISASVEKALYAEIEDVTKDEQLTKVGETLGNFFQQVRPGRVDAYVKTLGIPDSLLGQEPIDFTNFDTFENDEERQEISAAYG